jgi:hypothetical protein
VEIHYTNGGGAAGLPVSVSALMRNKYVNFADYDDFSFNPPRPQQQSASGDEEDQEGELARRSEKLVADKLPMTLDKDGNGKVTIKNCRR